MKKFLLFAMTLAFAFPVLADLDGDGYYRVQNAYTKRWAFLRDNKGRIDGHTTSADVGALRVYADHDLAITHPASVFYVSKAPTGTNKYDIAGQGTSIYSFMNMYLDIIPVRSQYDGQNCYYVYGTLSGVSKYLGDKWSTMSSYEGRASVDCTGDDRRWYVHPIDAASDEYFGIYPSVNANDRHYYPLFASFPFSAYSEGVRFHIITEIDPRGAAIVKEVEGTVPPATPVIVECSATSPGDNRLNVGGDAATNAAAGNKLKGVYFDNSMNTHYNRTRFDKKTMRVLGEKDGRLAFVESDIEFLPENQAYLQLTDAAQYDTPYFIVMTAEERDAEFGAVAVIPASSTVDVYSLDGRLVKTAVAKEDVRSLGKGLYILRSGGVSEKMIVK